MNLTPVDGNPFAQPAADPPPAPKLTPVEGNPFAVAPKLTPVEGNPFTATAAPKLTPVEGNPFEAKKPDTGNYWTESLGSLYSGVKEFGADLKESVLGAPQRFLEGGRGAGGIVNAVLGAPTIQKGMEASAGLLGVEGAPHIAEDSVKAAPEAAQATPKLTPVEGNPFSAVGAQPSPVRPNPEIASPEKGMRGLGQQQLGLAARDTAQQHETIERDIGPAEAKASPEDRVRLRNAIEMRSDNPDLYNQLPDDLKKAADTHQSLMRDAQFNMEELDPGAKQHFVKDYLSHMYKQPEKFTAWATTQARSIPTYAEAERLGFEPKYKSIADTDKEYLRITNRWNASRRIEDALRDQGHVSANPVAGPGEKLVNTGRFTMRPAYMPEKIANDYNALSSRPYSGRWAKAVEAVADFMHDLRSIAFAGNPLYHGVNETYEAIGHEASRVLNNAREGQLGQAAKSAGSMLTGPVSPYLRGSAGMKIYLNPSRMAKYTDELNREIANTGNVQDTKLIKELTQGNAIPNREFIDFGLNEDSIAKYIRRRGFNAKTLASAARDTGGALAKGAKQAIKTPIKSTLLAPRVALKGVAKALGNISEPLFGHIIPRVKLGAQMQMLEDWHIANPHATDAQTLAAVRKIAKNADNVFGEMNRDNLFMNRALLQALDITTLAPSWTIGSFKLLAGGTSGTLRRALATFMPFDREAPSFSMKNGEWDPTMTSFYGSTFASLLMGGSMTYLMTGSRPKELLDFIAPRTGGVHTEKNGKNVPARLKPMGNLGWDLSVAGAAGFPSAGTEGFQPNSMAAGQWARDKLNPAIGAGLDLLENKDFKGQPIMGKNPLGQAGAYMAKELTPFSFQEHSAIRAPDKAKLPLAAKVTGVPEAGMQYYDPKGYKEILKRKGKPADERKGK